MSADAGVFGVEVTGSGMELPWDLRPRSVLGAGMAGVAIAAERMVEGAVVVGGVFTFGDWDNGVVARALPLRPGCARSAGVCGTVVETLTRIGEDDGSFLTIGIGDDDAFVRSMGDAAESMAIGGDEPVRSIGVCPTPAALPDCVDGLPRGLGVGVGVEVAMESLSADGVFAVGVAMEWLSAT